MSRDSAPLEPPNYVPVVQRWGTIAGRILKLVIALAVVASLLTLAKHFTTAPKYVAVARLLPPFGEQDSLPVIQGGMGGYSSPSWWEPEDTTEANFLIIGILKSDRVLDFIIEKLDILEKMELPTLNDGRDWLRHQIVILQDPHKIIVIRGMAEDPQLAADLANTCLEGLEHTQRNLRKSHRSFKLQQVEVSIKRNRLELIEAETRFQAFKQRTGLVDVEAQTKATVEMLTQLKIMEVQNLVELTANQNYYTEKHSKVETFQSKMDKLKELQTKFFDQEDSVLAENFPELKDLPDLQRQFLHHLHEIDMIKETGSLLAKQLEAIRIQVSGNFPEATVLDFATPPSYDSNPSVIKALALTIVVCVFLYISLIAVIDLLLHFVPEYLTTNRLIRFAYRLLASLRLEPMLAEA